MKSTVKCGLIAGLILGIGYLCSDYIPVSLLHMVIIPATAMFSINEYLKEISHQKKYSYPLGVVLGFATCLMSIVVAYLFFYVLNSVTEASSKTFYAFQLGSIMISIHHALTSSLPLILLSSLLIPLMYIHQESEPNKHVDILDEEL